MLIRSVAHFSLTEGRNSSPCGLNRLTHLLRKIDNYGTTERKSGSGHPRSVRTAVNISTVDDTICSQDNAPCSHKSPREICCAHSKK